MEKTNEASDGRKEKRGLFTLSFFLHTSLLIYWICVHVHELSLISHAESMAGEGYHFPKTLEFPGRWKYLTLVNMVSETVLCT